MIDLISPAQAKTLPGLFLERVRRSPDAVAYRQFDAEAKQWKSVTWLEMARRVVRWQAALLGEGLQRGERVAIMLRNCCEWVAFEQAALGLGLVVVPLYTHDRAESTAYILDHSQVKLLFIDGDEHWRCLSSVRDNLRQLQKIICMRTLKDAVDDGRVQHVDSWLPNTDGDMRVDIDDGEALATIVYTSGTTGRPKGVMLSHRNILWNASSCIDAAKQIFTTDVFLSFLPLSHMLERTVGHYLPMMAGATVAHARSIADLGEDLITIKPTIIISVPRIFERICNKVQTQLQGGNAVARQLFGLAIEVGWAHFEYRQGRARWTPRLLLWPLLNTLVAKKLMEKLGGRIRIAVCGGAPLSAPVGKLFVGLGLPLIQGYGMTEASPVMTVNRVDDNDPASVGPPLKDVEIRIAENSELLVKSPGVMLGYWQAEEATRATIDAGGWLRTGDQARVENGHIYITGRLKEIIVLANGEKVSPVDMELAIAADPLFEQIVVVGEQKPYLAALVVLSSDHNISGDISKVALERIATQLRHFPGYAQVRRIAIFDEKWTVENGLMTPTLKLRRNAILERFKKEVDALYAGHGLF